MRKIFYACCLIITAIIFESSAINGNIPPKGFTFNDTHNIYSDIIESENGIGWRIINNMKGGSLRVTLYVSGGGESSMESVTLSNYSSYKVGALAPSTSEGGLIPYVISGSATCNYSSDDNPPYGVVACYYYRSDMI
jgi:hypothetical protein